MVHDNTDLNVVKLLLHCYLHLALICPEVHSSFLAHMSFSMSGPATSPLDEEGGVSRHLIACNHVICQYGRCVLVNGESSCECNLGYTGDTCNETINEALSVPLTLGVLVIIIGFIILMFGLAFFRQRQKAKKRKKAAEESLIRNGEHL